MHLVPNPKAGDGTSIADLLAMPDADLARATANLDVVQTRVALGLLQFAGLKTLVIGRLMQRQDLVDRLCDNDAPETTFSPQLA